MIKRKKTFKGGYRFGAFQGQPEESAKEAAIPSKVTLLLQQNEQKLIALVEPGETVQTGQIIADGDYPACSPVLSTVNGTVEAIHEIDWFGRKVNAVSIESDGSSDWKPVGPPQRDWRHLRAHWLEDRIYRSGVTVLGSGGIPTRSHSSVIGPGEVEHVIIHSVEDDVFNISPKVIFQINKLHPFLEGIAILRRIMPHAEFHLALNRERSDLVAEITHQTEGMNWLRVHGVSPKYPQAMDEMLVKVILDREFPFGYCSANIGVVLLDFQTIHQVYETVTEGKPLMERTITLSGPGFKEKFHLKVRIGASFESIIGSRLIQEKMRIVRNSPLSGETISDLSLPLDPACTNISALIEQDEGESFSFLRPGLFKDSASRTFVSVFLPFLKKEINTNIHGDHRACLSCGYCSDVCPVDILPNLIHRYVSKDIVDERIMNLGVHRCIECNLCTYVCPSKIPVAGLIRDGKKKLLEEGLNPAALILNRVPLKGLPKAEETGENEGENE